ncbi:MAG: glycine betaine/L-proline ABC transporter substrate-binding protein ProX [Halothece sp.]
MIQQNFKSITTLTASVALLLGVSACQPQGGNDTADDQNSEETAEQPGTGVEVTPAYSVLEERFQTEVVNMALEELGYDVVEPKELEYATMHTDLAGGGLDFTPVHWEKLHSDFYSEAGSDEDLKRMGIIVEDMKQGYLIDRETAEEYDITNIEQLQDPEIAELFDTNDNGKANLTGCNPGWGCELVIEHHLEEYELEETVEHDQGQYMTLMADTITRFEQDEPILYYTWTPLWVSSVLRPDEEVVWLEVPETSVPEEQQEDGEVTEEDTTVDGQNLGFALDQMWVLANREFAEENPAAASVFESVQIPIDDISEQNERMRDGEDSEEDIRAHAEEWVEENQEQFDQWVSQAREASE